MEERELKKDLYRCLPVVLDCKPRRLHYRTKQIIKKRMVYKDLMLANDNLFSIPL